MPTSHELINWTRASSPWIGLTMVFPIIVFWIDIPTVPSVGWLVLIFLLVEAYRIFRGGRPLLDQYPHTALILYGLTMLMFSMTLSHIFSTGGGGYANLGGLLPWSDAKKYYAGAVSLNESGTYGPWQARRPLAHGFFAVILPLTGMNLQAMLVLSSMMLALSSFFLGLEIKRTHGFIPALVAICALFVAGNHVIGTTLSETPGMIFGTLGIGFLWRGFHQGALKAIYWGLLLLAIGLSIRAGAMFILPLLGCLAAWFFGRTALQRIKILGVAALIAVTPTLISLGLNAALLEGDSGGLNANFSYSFYAMAHGGASKGKSWGSFLEDYPEAKNLPVKEKVALAYRQAFKKIVSDPKLFSKSLKGNFPIRTIFLTRNTLNFYWNGPYPGNLILMVLLLIGLVATIRNFGQITFTLLGVSLLGIYVSSPFLADGDIRVFLPTFAVQAAVAAVAWPELVRWTHSILSKPLPDKGMGVFPPVRMKQDLSVWLSGALAVAIVFWPLLLGVVVSPPMPVDHPSCETGTPLDFFAFPGAELEITEGLNRVPQVSRAVFTRNLSLIERPDQFSKLGPDAKLRYVITHRGVSGKYLTYPGELGISDGNRYLACGERLGKDSFRIIPGTVSIVPRN